METRCFLEKITQPESFYTTAGRDGRDKYQGFAYDVKKTSSGLSSNNFFPNSYDSWQESLVSKKNISFDILLQDL